MILIQGIFIGALVLLTIPVIVFSLQVLLSLLPYINKPMPKTARPTIDVLIPAHNEQLGLSATLESLRGQLTPNDRMVVVADNCTDETATVARNYGAIAIERTDAVNRGKSYALDYGMRYLEANTPADVVIILDADCLIQAGSIQRLASLAIAKNRPVQSLYLMYSPPNSSLKTKIAEFAWAVKNWARALGYHHLGLPCQLMGTGMAFPWHLIQQVDIANGHIVEDLKLGLDLASRNTAPLFCPEAVVTSVFPINNEGAKSQRTRWEHGHLAMIATEGPGLLLKSVSSLNIGMLALVLDMCVPPLALLTLMVLGLASAGVLLITISHVVFPGILAVFLLMLLGISVLLAWVKFGRSILSLASLGYAPIYMLAKIPLYLKFVVRRQVEWVRSKRD